jgi:hypothetical protein
MLWKSTHNAKDLKNILGRIEILNENRQLEVVFFQIPENVVRFWKSHLINNFREDLIQRVKRDNPEEKVNSFFAKLQH